MHESRVSNRAEEGNEEENEDQQRFLFYVALPNSMHPLERPQETLDVMWKRRGYPRETYPTSDNMPTSLQVSTFQQYLCELVGQKQLQTIWHLPAFMQDAFELERWAELVVVVRSLT
mmetsp:Transcript_16505/g.36147  ORF Transcript_16505/g.36147 Transcript_16505/m.36147 type:complete len:117 (+) Transcript_16505:834-1184(+)